MDHAFAIEKLKEFVDSIDATLEIHEKRPNPYLFGDGELAKEFLFMDILARQIENAYRPGLGNYPTEGSRSERMAWARKAAIEALGRAKASDEIAAFLRPSSPSIAASSLHPWVWEPAAPLWAASARQDAVLSAARTVNRRIQQKINRHDIGETDLCMQSFDIKDPAPAKPRLRFPGSRESATWRARQDGAKYLAAGVFLAIRNVAAHEDKVSWSEHEALEFLATLSVLARWVEECDVEAAR